MQVTKRFSKDGLTWIYCFIHVFAVQNLVQHKAGEKPMPDHPTELLAQILRLVSKGEKLLRDLDKFVKVKGLWAQCKLARILLAADPRVGV
jgi:hypothetical protein